MVSVPWQAGPLSSPESNRSFKIKINLIQGRKESELRAVRHILPVGCIQQEAPIIELQFRFLMRRNRAQVNG